VSDSTGVARRTVLTGAGAAAGALALAACSSGTTKAAPATAASTPAVSTDAPAAAAGGTAKPLATLADIPVGTAVAAKDGDGKPVLVAQPSAGTAVAFSAICTHMGCTVAPAGKELHCPCHGSVYEAATGKVIDGPAPAPLHAVAVHVQDGKVLPGSA
jgi:Rieske Fe-S protein